MYDYEHEQLVLSTEHEQNLKKKKKSLSTQISHTDAPLPMLIPPAPSHEWPEQDWYPAQSPLKKC